MKRRTILTVALIVQSLFLIGQNQTFDPPKKANAVVIETTDSAVTLLIDYAKHLQDVGFTIDKVDKEFLLLSTEFKKFKFGGQAVIRIVAFARQNGTKARLEIKGDIEITDVVSGVISPFVACNCGMKIDARRKGFNEVLKTVDGFAYDIIEFKIKE